MIANICNRTTISPQLEAALGKAMLAEAKRFEHMSGIKQRQAQGAMKTRILEQLAQGYRMTNQISENLGKSTTIVSASLTSMISLGEVKIIDRIKRSSGGGPEKCVYALTGAGRAYLDGKQ